jgi:hypothetical protein
MAWSHKLSETIALKGGRKITTLGDVREIMLSIPLASRKDSKWRYLGELSKDAAANNSYGPRPHLEKQLIVALRAEGLL